MVGSQARLRFNVIAVSSQPGRSGDGGSAGVPAKPDRITSPAIRCSSRRLRGTCGLPINQNISRPKPGRKKISSSQAIADDGRCRSGTRPSAITLIAKIETVTRIVTHDEFTIRPSR